MSIKHDMGELFRFWWDYFNLLLANEYVGDVTIPTQVIEYNQQIFQADQPIRLQYSNQIKLLRYIRSDIVKKEDGQRVPVLKHI